MVFNMESLLDRLRRHEGCSLVPYLDTTGNMTVGWGHKMESVSPSILENGITQDEADHLLEVDIEIAKNGVSRLPAMVLNNCNEVRRGVLIEQIFQLGLSGTLKFKKQLKAIENGDFNKASREMLDSRWAKQTPSRVTELAEIMKNG